MDFDEIMELMKESADSIADPSPEDYPELGREERERMFAMSEKKYNNTSAPGVSEEHTEIEVKGVERYHRPVWHRFVSIAAAIALIAGIGGGANYLKKKGTLVNDPTAVEDATCWDFQAIAAELTDKMLDYTNYCISCQVDRSEEGQLHVEYKYTDGTSASNVVYYEVLDDRFKTSAEINEFVESFASGDPGGFTGRVAAVKYEDITPVEKTEDIENAPFDFIRMFVEKDGKLYRQGAGENEGEVLKWADSEIDICEVPEVVTEGAKFSAKRTMKSPDDNASIDYIITFIYHDGRWVIENLGSVVGSQTGDMKDEDAVSMLTSVYITCLNWIEEPTCDENDVIRMYCDVPEGLTADNFETPEQYHAYQNQKDAFCSAYYARMTDFGNEEDMRKYMSAFMTEEALETFMFMHIAGRYTSDQVVDGTITETYENYSATVGNTDSTYANIIIVDGNIYVHSSGSKTTWEGEPEIVRNGDEICARRHVWHDHADEYADGYMYFTINKIDDTYKINLIGEKAYCEYMTALAVQEQEEKNENKPAAGNEHNTVLATDEDIKAMAVDLTDGFVDLRNISEFGLTADTNDSFAATDIGYYYYRVTDSRFTDTASLISYARSILSEELETSDPKLTISSQCGSIAEKGPDAVAFTDNNGVLYTRSAHNSDIRAFEYKSDTVEISDVERDSAGNATSFTASRQVVYWDVTEPVMYNFTVKNTDAGWRITGYTKTGGYEEEAAELMKAVRSLRPEAMETEGEELIYTQYFGKGEDLHREGATPGEYAVYSYYPVKGSLTLDILRGKAHSVFTDECISNHEGIATNKLDDMKLFGGDTSAYGSGYTWASEDEAAFAPDLGVFIEYNGRLYVLANGSSWLLDPGEKNTAAEVLEGSVRYATDDKFELYVNVEPSDETYGLSIVTYDVVKQDGQWKISGTGLSTGAM